MTSRSPALAIIATSSAHATGLRGRPAADCRATFPPWWRLLEFWAPHGCGRRSRDGTRPRRPFLGPRAKSAVVAVSNIGKPQRKVPSAGFFLPEINSVKPMENSYEPRGRGVHGASFLFWLVPARAFARHLRASSACSAVTMLSYSNSALIACDRRGPILRQPQISFKPMTMGADANLR